MYTQHNRQKARAKRHQRVRRYIMGTTERPRLAVFRSLHHVSAQIIDDSTGRTLAAASTYEEAVRQTAVGSLTSCSAAAAVGKALAERALKAGITAVVFDRSGYPYHGRIQALAEAARQAGMRF